MTVGLRVLHFPANYPDPDYDQPNLMIFIEEHLRSAALYHHRNVVLYISPLPSRCGRVEVTRRQEKAGWVVRIHTVRTGVEFVDRLQVYWAVVLELFRLLASGFLPQIVHVHVFSIAKIPSFLSKVFRVPLVVTEHWSALCREGVLSRERLDLARRVYEQAAFVLPVCEHLRKCIEVNTGAKMRSEIVFNAVDAGTFYEDGRERRRQILTVARLDPVKDIPSLLKAFAILEDKSLTLKIVGRGDAAPLIELSKELGIHEQVEFSGELEKTVIAELMRDSAVFALSSVWENSPCVIGEALCCGLPVVATQVGGVPELLTQADGRLVPHSQPEAMARALEEILKHPEQFNGYKIADRARARFGYEAIGAQLDEVYREAARG